MSEVDRSPATRNDDTAAVIREYIVSHFPLSKQLASADGDSLLDSGVVDSLGILEIVTFLTEKFSVEVGDEDLVPENFGSVTALATFVQMKLGKDAR